MCANTQRYAVRAIHTPSFTRPPSVSTFHDYVSMSPIKSLIFFNCTIYRSPKASYVTHPVCKVSPLLDFKQGNSLAIYVSINVLDYSVVFYQMSAWQISASQRVLTLSLFNNDPTDL